WNDPDAVTLSGTMPPEEYRFHASAILASGGMVLSGDDLSTLEPDRRATFKKLLPPTGVAAEFEDESLRIGVVKLKDRTLICVFNWGPQPVKMPVKLQTSGRVTDLWSGQIYTRTGDSVEVSLQPHEGTVLVVR